ncbi:hypothetical protein ACRALDRAFT_206142 [Sodiomyces alcalophilus JCM 7366]|uniref:uncharacterized protein n=1 Tax=Sodiomyces alcalophilus JCM 7366 TaxID=591952 RepID=UPI0039B67586
MYEVKREAKKDNQAPHYSLRSFRPTTNTTIQGAAQTGHRCAASWDTNTLYVDGNGDSPTNVAAQFDAKDRNVRVISGSSHVTGLSQEATEALRSKYTRCGILSLRTLYALSLRLDVLPPAYYYPGRAGDVTKNKIPKRIEMNHGVGTTHRITKYMEAQLRVHHYFVRCTFALESLTRMGNIRGPHFPIHANFSSLPTRSPLAQLRISLSLEMRESQIRTSYNATYWSSKPLYHLSDTLHCHCYWAFSRPRMPLDRRPTNELPSEELSPFLTILMAAVSAYPSGPLIKLRLSILQDHRMATRKLAMDNYTSPGIKYVTIIGLQRRSHGTNVNQVNDI